jgi:hypothetical protein
MVVLALAGLAIAWIYYSGINRSSDPRVRDARTMYGRFNVYAATNEDEKILSLLDSIYGFSSLLIITVTHMRSVW